MGNSFVYSQLVSYLDEVDQLLSDEVLVEGVVIGGFALVPERPYRETEDIDFLSPAPLPEELREAGEVVAGRFGLNSDWINSGVIVVSIPIPQQLRKLYTGNHLILYRPNDEFLLATKIYAGREKDNEDATQLMRRTGIYTVKELTNLVMELFRLEKMHRYSIRQKAERIVTYARNTQSWYRGYR